jgi:hypothetical protein
MKRTLLIVLCCIAPATGLAEDSARTRDQTRTPGAAAQATAKTPQTKSSDQARALTADQTRKRDQLRDQIHKDAKLTASEQQALAEPLDHYVAQGGNPERLRAMVRASLESGCKGVCLAEMVRSLNRTQHQGFDEDRAFEAVGTALREMKQERDRQHQSASDVQVRDRLRQRIDTELQRGDRGQGMKRGSAQPGTGPQDRMPSRSGPGPHHTPGGGQGPGQGHRGGPGGAR